MSSQSLVQSSCPSCGQARWDRHRTFLGFQKRTCAECRLSTTEPLPTAARVVYFLVAVAVSAACAKHWLEGRLAWPGGLALLCLWALAKDAVIRGRTHPFPRSSGTDDGPSSVPQLAPPKPDRVSVPVHAVVDAPRNMSPTSPLPPPQAAQERVRSPWAPRIFAASALLSGAALLHLGLCSWSPYSSWSNGRRQRPILFDIFPADNTDPAVAVTLGCALPAVLVIMSLALLTRRLNAREA
jgi:hypothetical protein